MSTSDFQAFQHAFARHIRDPHHTPRPAGVPARRMAVYNELLFNNITGFLDACFPVCRKVIGERRWRRLNRAFYRDWKSHTPWFHEIPREFVRYLNEGVIRQPLPAWFVELAHYEWAELAVDTMDCQIPGHDPAGDLMQQP
ncbi:MAG: putative DNA-binding domain-containing protein, partial [Dechloromonas sp.]|nr:putative DNA-binding domain-containing protein [Dechloromonas sp.]